MTASTVDNAAVLAAHQQGREDERRDLLLWLDAVVQLELHQRGDLAGAELLRSIADRAERRDHLGGA